MRPKKPRQPAADVVQSTRKPELKVTVDEKTVPKLPHEVDESARGNATPRKAIFGVDEKTTASSR